MTGALFSQLLQSSRKLVRLYRTFGLVIFLILPDQQLLYQTEYIVTWFIIRNMAAVWKKDKKWVIKTVLINDLRFCMSCSQSMDVMIGVFIKLQHFPFQFVFLSQEFAGHLVWWHLIFSPTGFGKHCSLNYLLRVPVQHWRVVHSIYLSLADLSCLREDLILSVFWKVSTGAHAWFVNGCNIRSLIF